MFITNKGMNLYHFLEKLTLHVGKMSTIAETHAHDNIPMF